MAFLVFLCIFFSLLVHSRIHLPGPSGPCLVQTRSAELIDTSRVDPFSLTHDTRAIMVTSYAPVHCGEVQHTPYIPPQIAQEAGQRLGLPNGTHELFQSPSWTAGHRDDGTREYPVILFSHGLGSSRMIYSNLLEEVASAGFIVVSVDHPHDAGVVEFPDGRLIFASADAINNIPLALETRVDDSIFTLNQLHNNVRSIIPSSFRGNLQLDRVAAIGHSLGGATAAQTMLNDTRFVGEINFDGTLYGSVVKQGLDRPFINFGRAELTDESASWREIWPHLRDFRLQLQLKDSKHVTFTDLPLVFDAAPFSNALRNATADHIGPFPGLGTLPGLRVKTIMSEYITAACGFFVTGEKPALLRGPSLVYPEVMYMRS